MAEVHDFLLEIGTEELPPKALPRLSQALETEICAGLGRLQLNYGAVSRFATPRRLALLIRDLSTRQPDQQLQRRGPALRAAFQDGRPTKAAEGFARSCGVAVAELQTVETDKGAWLAHVWTEAGGSTRDLLPAVINSALHELPIPKRMRWGNGDEEFVRPVHWVVLLLGSEPIPATVLGISAGRSSRGHRFHHPEAIEIPEPAAYPDLLSDPGRVMADFAQRRTTIVEQAQKAAATVAGKAVIDPGLLNEVTALVEWPVALLGNFERRYLKVPAEALITTMQDNQKYFPVVDEQGGLLPHFITISNLVSQQPEQVRAGNERVIRPRFADAEFFWQQDRKRPLSSRVAALQQVVFEQQLGTLHDKSRRVASLASHIARRLDADAGWAERAAWLSKCDLLTDMVQEFPELQGVMGRYYASHDAEPPAVAQALEEQYRPRYAGDGLPRSTTGQILALADRLDTLLGIFAIGQPPSGARDPFGLRRAALGIVRILIEEKLDLDLEDLLSTAAAGFAAELKAGHSVEAVFDFVFERLRAYYAERGFPNDVFEAVLQCRPGRPLDFHRRIQAVAAFRELPAAASLAAANKRIRNILRKVEGTLPFRIDPVLLRDEAEQQLAGRLAELSSEVVPLLDRGLYEEALVRLADLRTPVDSFFDEVLVMAEDKAVRSNRIALLNELESLFLRVADFSCLQTGG